MSTAQARDTGLVHEALLYLDAEEYVSGIERFLVEGLERAEPALVAVPDSHLEVLRATLSADAQQHVRFVDMVAVGVSGVSAEPAAISVSLASPAGKGSVAGSVARETPTGPLSSEEPTNFVRTRPRRR